MISILKNLEKTAENLDPVILLVPGLFFLCIGLFIWLGGAGLKRTLSVCLAAVVGAIAGFIASDANMTVTIICAISATVFALVLQKTFFITLIALLTALSVFCIVSGICAKEDVFGDVGQTYSNDLNLQNSAAAIAERTDDIGSIFYKAGKELSIHYWILVAASGILAGFISFFIFPIASAICLSFTGSVLIFAGMSFLLLFKGTAPFTIIFKKPCFYSLIFTVMVVFGTIVQLLVGVKSSKKAKEKPKDSENRKSKKDRTD